MKLTRIVIEAGSPEELATAARLLGIVPRPQARRVPCGTPGVDPRSGRRVRCVCPTHVRARSNGRVRARDRRASP